MPAVPSTMVEVALPVFVALLLGVTLTRRALLNGAARRDALAGGIVFFCALAMACLAGLHTGVVTLTRIFAPPVPPPETQSMTILGVTYDFRLYALVLLGVSLFTRAARAVALSRQVAEGDTAARASLHKTLAGLLALSVPLIPLQVHGITFTMLCLVIYTALVLSRPSAIRAANVSPIRAAA